MTQEAVEKRSLTESHGTINWEQLVSVIQDSKQLTAPQRETLVPLIRQLSQVIRETPSTSLEKKVEAYEKFRIKVEQGLDKLTCGRPFSSDLELVDEVFRRLLGFSVDRLSPLGRKGKELEFMEITDDKHTIDTGTFQEAVKGLNARLESIEREEARTQQAR